MRERHLIACEGTRGTLLIRTSPRRGHRGQWVPWFLVGQRRVWMFDTMQGAMRRAAEVGGVSMKADILPIIKRAKPVSTNVFERVDKAREELITEILKGTPAALHAQVRAAVGPKIDILHNAIVEAVTYAYVAPLRAQDPTQR